MAVRRVRRIIRKIDPWTVLKVVLVLNTIIALIWTLGVWIAWSIAVQRGIPDDFVNLFARLTIAVTPEGDLYFRVVVMFAVVWVIVATAAVTLAAVLYNLISDIVGGVEVIMLEETVEPSSQPIAPRPVVHVQPASDPTPMTTQDTVESD